ncbi:hypothetical protein GOP47_0008581 [Adiantum capillus-veneris]|uniref:Cupin type-1 domain-containing protein n=1 Tax=Adiantum capillus-veneris TaxID=13818 RepID=A0A9D4UYN9_ADICA|nr:hypothetical protein GOP47_0008581 [Adiantum capillus-veneris]
MCGTHLLHLLSLLAELSSPLPTIAIFAKATCFNPIPPDDNTSFSGSFQTQAKDDTSLGKKKLELELSFPQEEFHFEGGSLRVWRRDVITFPDKQLDVSEIIFQEDGLLLPQYADADGISYVLQGTGKLGVVSLSESGLPQSSIRRVEQGDVLAIPKGAVFWWYNDGYGEHRIFCASDTSGGVNSGLYHQFTLAGARMDRFGGLLHGFGVEVLADAWNVDEDIVTRLLESQNGTTIVKSPRRIRLPDPRGIGVHSSHGGIEVKQTNFKISEFRYNLNREYPDLYVKRGGWKKGADESNLPVLRKVGMSALRVGLEPNAVEAPLYFSNANQIVYIIRGNGRIEVASNDGESILDKYVGAGTILAIPKFTPSIKVAGDGGLSFLTFLTSSRPLPSYLIGRNSFYEGIPTQVMAEAFDVDESTLLEVQEKRKVDELYSFLRQRHRCLQSRMSTALLQAEIMYIFAC